MARVFVKLVGQETLKRTFSLKDKEIRTRLRVVLDRFSADILNRAQGNASTALHTESGRLKKSIRRRLYETKTGSILARIGTKLFYGKFWEKGFQRAFGKNWQEHRPEPARPFLVPALEAVRDALRNELIAAAHGR